MDAALRTCGLSVYAVQPKAHVLTRSKRPPQCALSMRKISLLIFPDDVFLNPAQSLRLGADHQHELIMGSFLACDTNNIGIIRYKILCDGINSWERAARPPNRNAPDSRLSVPEPSAIKRVGEIIAVNIAYLRGSAPAAPCASASKS